MSLIQRVLYVLYIATTSNDNPKLSTLVGEWENSHNFYLESFDNCLRYSLVSLNPYSFGMGYECLTGGDLFLLLSGWYCPRR